MNKKKNSNTRHPPSSGKLTGNAAPLENAPSQQQAQQIKAQQHQAQAQSPALPTPGQPSPERFERVLFGQAPSLSPNLPEIVQPSDALAGREAIRRRVLMLGLRGVPNVQGGVEKHVEMLGQELVARGWDVEVLGRSRYLPKKTPPVWRGIRITPFWAPKSMLLEAFVHTILGVFYAAVRRPDIVHIHAIGPGLLAPLARLFGLRVVVTHHGYDYDREKWSPLAKRVLKLGERLSMLFANGRIAVSRDVTETMKRRYGTDVAHIPNGVTVRPSLVGKGVLDHFGLQRRKYIVMVARFVPEKRQTDLIAAFAKLKASGLKAQGWKLVLVGGADHARMAYSRDIETLAAQVPDVVLTGFQSGEELAALFSQAGLFVLPSIHEGMPISLLEAMSYGLPVLASDIVANHEVDLPPEDYFPAGDIDSLAAALGRKIEEPFGQDVALRRIREIENAYSWPSITRRTLAVYTSLVPADKKEKR